MKEKKGWGGKREGAGRKPGPKPGVRHRPRPALAARHPVHVTLRTREHVWNLRSRRSFAVIEAALHGIMPRPDFRVVHSCPARGEADPYSSAAVFDGWSSGALSTSAASATVLPVAPARTWLLATGWRRQGLLSLDETPAAG